VMRLDYVFAMTAGQGTDVLGMELVMLFVPEIAQDQMQHTVTSAKQTLIATKRVSVSALINSSMTIVPCIKAYATIDVSPVADLTIPIALPAEETPKPTTLMMEAVSVARTGEVLDAQTGKVLAILNVSVVSVLWPLTVLHVLQTHTCPRLMDSVFAKRAGAVINALIFSIAAIFHVTPATKTVKAAHMSAPHAQTDMFYLLTRLDTAFLVIRLAQHALVLQKQSVQVVILDSTITVVHAKHAMPHVQSVLVKVPKLAPYVTMIALIQVVSVCVMIWQGMTYPLHVVGVQPE